MNHSETIKELAAALAKAQGQIEGAKKESEAAVTSVVKRKYADLSSVWDACRKPLSANGLSIAQFTEGGPDQVTVITRLLHESGEWMEGSLTLRPTKPDPQGMGSAITYARRYALMAMVGVAPEDDDAQEASKPVQYQNQQRPAQAQAQAQQSRQVQPLATQPKQALNLITDSKRQALEKAGEIQALQQEYGLTQEEVQQIGAVTSIKELVRDDDLPKLQEVYDRIHFHVNNREAEASA